MFDQAGELFLSVKMVKEAIDMLIIGEDWEKALQRMLAQSEQRDDTYKLQIISKQCTTCVYLHTNHY